MHSSRGPRGLLVSLLGVAMAIAVAGAPAMTQETGGGRCELGVALALSGNTAEAESVFVSVLSVEPEGARALANLGNLYLMKNELDVALAFYDMAFKADPNDAGILLNRAIALMLMGEEDLAQEQAKEGVEMAGGLKAASWMLGLRWTDAGQDVSKRAEKAYVSKEEIGALLEEALKSVPADSAMADSTAAVPKEKTRLSWRSAGARAAGATQVGQVLYWKR
jgi:tetratricopeptide (TPR) repeat protein